MISLLDDIGPHLRGVGRSKTLSRGYVFNVFWFERVFWKDIDTLAGVGLCDYLSLPFWSFHCTNPTWQNSIAKCNLESRSYTSLRDPEWHGCAHWAMLQSGYSFLILIFSCLSYILSHLYLNLPFFPLSLSFSLRNRALYHSSCLGPSTLFVKDLLFIGPKINLPDYICSGRTYPLSPLLVDSSDRQKADQPLTVSGAYYVRCVLIVTDTYRGVERQR